jgi:hypothetical protein
MEALSGVNLTSGLRETPAAEPAHTVSPAQTAPLGFWKIAGAVMVGNLMAGVIGAIVYALSQAH